MNTVMGESKRRVTVVVIAIAMALSITVGQVVLTSITGIELTSTAHACQHPGGGC